MRLSSTEFRGLERKAVTLIGMSGVGKTSLARKVPSTSWFHYSADYRIATRYLVEPILDNIKEEAMKVDFLRDLLRSDSIFIGSNITFDNLDLLSKFVGKLGNESSGGLSWSEFTRRQKLHYDAEVASMLDVGEYIRKAKTIYGYDHFVNDSSGSLCELNDERVFDHLAQHTIIIYLASGEELEEQIIERQVSNPKPLFYNADFLNEKFKEYLDLHGFVSEQQINPNEFVQWIFPSLIRVRRPRYEAIASKYGYVIPADAIDGIRDEQDFIDLVCTALDAGK